jgi:hypothetical protein
LGIWSNAFGSLSLVARLGDAMPGGPEGSYLEDFDGAKMNELGQTAFVGFLDGATVDRSKNTGVWAQDSNGILHLIARAGEVLEVGPGDFRQVKVVGLGGINDLGQIAVLARFVDGSQGMFLSNLVAVPEPGLWGLVLPIVLMGLGWGTRRHGRRAWAPGSGKC